jgi:hypothetical protein
MRRNKISIEEHNDNFMLVFFGIIIGMVMVPAAYLLVTVMK